MPLPRPITKPADRRTSEGAGLRLRTLYPCPALSRSLICATG